MQPWAEVIGDPIAQSKSPIIHGFWMQALGIDGRYGRTLVHPEALASFIADRRGAQGWRGCNVTMPHKIAVAGLVGDLDPLARKAQAVNAVENRDGRLIGHNTDASGLLDLLESELPGHGDARFDIIGAGGAARAVAAALHGRKLRILNRTRATADALASEFGGVGAGLEALMLPPPAGAPTIIINASSLGMIGHPPLAIDLSIYPGDTSVVDLVYHPLETPLLAEAKRVGIRHVDGLAFLIAQAARAFSIFFGQAPPRENDDELKALLLR